MPMPTPNKGEEKNDFISRCMKNSVMKDYEIEDEWNKLSDAEKRDFPNTKQRVAVCHDLWRKRNKEQLNWSAFNKFCEKYEKQKHFSSNT